MGEDGLHRRRDHRLPHAQLDLRSRWSLGDRGEVLLDEGQALTAELLDGIPQMYWNVIEVDPASGVTDGIERLVRDLREEI